MKILIAAFYPTRNQGGRPASARALASALARAGHELIVVAARQRDEEIIETVKTSWGRKFDDEGVQVHLLDSIYLRRIVTLNPKLGRFWTAIGQGVDVVHVFGLYDFLGPAIARRCKRDGIPYSVEPCGMLTPRSRGLWSKKLFHLLVTQPLLNGTQAVVVTSNGEREEVLARCPGVRDVQLRHNGVESAAPLPVDRARKVRSTLFRQWGMNSNVPYLVYLGAIAQVKGLDLLITALTGFSGARWPLSG